MKTKMILAVLALSSPLLATAHGNGFDLAAGAGYHAVLATQSTSISGGQSSADTSGSRSGSTFIAENMGTTSSTAQSTLSVNPLTGALNGVSRTTASNDNASMVSGMGNGHAAAGGTSASENFAQNLGAAHGWAQFKLGGH